MLRSLRWPKVLCLRICGAQVCLDGRAENLWIGIPLKLRIEDEVNYWFADYLELLAGLC